MNQIKEARQAIENTLANYETLLYKIDFLISELENKSELTEGQAANLKLLKFLKSCNQ